MNQCPQGNRLQKYTINNLCIPFTLDKAFWVGGKFTGFIYLGWHHCSAKPWLASSFHPKPQVYLWEKIFGEVNMRGDVTKEAAASFSEKVKPNIAKNYKLKITFHCFNIWEYLFCWTISVINIVEYHFFILNWYKNWSIFLLISEIN